MPNLNNYHAYKSTSGGTGGGSGGNNIGCGGYVVIIIVIIMLLAMIVKGSDWEAIDSLLGVGLLVFLVANWFTK